MHYFLFADKDTTIYQSSGSLNAGLDEILEVRKDISDTGASVNVSRILIKFDLDGNIVWQLELNDILKTPIKIYNENIIVLLSNKIISVDTINETIDWEFIYNSDN